MLINLRSCHARHAAQLSRNFSGNLKTPRDVRHLKASLGQLLYSASNARRDIQIVNSTHGGHNASMTSTRTSSSNSSGKGIDSVKTQVSIGSDDAEPVEPTGKKPPNFIVSKLGHYAGLSKARLSSLVVLTTGAGYAIGPAAFDYGTVTAACVGTALCAASAGTFNQIFEIDQDSKMNRTKKRPLPSGAVSTTEATMFGLTTGAAGTGLLLTLSNPAVAALGLGNIALYAGAYTYSKRISELNTWLGSLVGAIPPLMGWLAAGGSMAAPEPYALGSLLFLWQFPHFFSLSWMHREDYARGGFRMVATADPHGERSAHLIWKYSLYLTALPVVVATYELTSWMFAVEATVVNSYLLYLAHKFKKDRSNANARRIFLCSLWYLPLVLGALALHQRNKHEKLLYEEDLSLAKTHDELRERGRELCPHEVILGANHTSNNHTNYTKEGIKKPIQSQELSWIMQKVIQYAPPFCVKLLVTDAVNEGVAAGSTVSAAVGESFANAQQVAVTTTKGPTDVSRTSN